MPFAKILPNKYIYFYFSFFFTVMFSNCTLFHCSILLLPLGKYDSPPPSHPSPGVLHFSRYCRFLHSSFFFLFIWDAKLSVLYLASWGRFSRFIFTYYKRWWAQRESENYSVLYSEEGNLQRIKLISEVYWMGYCWIRDCLWKFNEWIHNEKYKYTCVTLSSI